MCRFYFLILKTILPKMERLDTLTNKVWKIIFKSIFNYKKEKTKYPACLQILHLYCRVPWKRHSYSKIPCNHAITSAQELWFEAVLVSSVLALLIFLLSQIYNLIIDVLKEIFGRFHRVHQEISLPFRSRVIPLTSVHAVTKESPESFIIYGILFLLSS